jgi:hypothetical protein
MKFHLIDWVIMIGSILICFIPALFVGKRAGKTPRNSSPRALRSLVAGGLSMVATTFSSDTPTWSPILFGGQV